MFASVVAVRRLNYKDGKWFDHENQVGGGVLDLISKKTGGTRSEALEWLREQGFYAGPVSHQSSSTPTRSRPAAINTVGKIIETYDYPDEQGNLIFQVLRFDPKDFRQRRPARPDDDPKKVRDGGWVWEVRGERPVPYRLPEVREAIALGRPIWVVEGEKDADNLWRLGIPATCNAGGVGKWSEEHSEFFRGVDVIIVQDNDPQARNPAPPHGDGALRWHPDGRPVLPGQDHAQTVARALSGVAARLRLIDLAQGWPALKPKDVSDCIAGGATADQLWELAGRTPDWSLPATDPDATTPDATSWENPNLEVLEDGRGNLPEFPTELLDPEWSDYIERAARGAGVTPAHVAVPLIGIISGVIGCSYRIKATRSWSEPCAIWCAVVGYSGTGKTPGIDVSKRALAFVEKERRDKIARLQREHETRAEAAKAAQDKWKQEVEEAIEAGKEPPQQPPGAASVGKFVRPRLYVTDTTVERAAVLLQARPSGLLLVSDELSGFFANMSRYSNGSDREFWLESWNGKHYVVERMGRDPVVLDHLLIGVIGGLQPDKLVRSFEGDDDGMYARVCFSWPSEPSYRPLSNEEYEPIIINALDRLVEELPIKSQDRGFVAGEMCLSEDAEHAFGRFLQFLHEKKDGLDGREREWWVKGGGQVIRLAGALALLSWAAKVGSIKPEKIERRFLDAAIGIWRDYFWPHSRAALRQVGSVFRWAVKARLIKTDPTAGVDNPPLPKNDGFAPWSEDDISAYERRWPIGTRQRVWLDVLIYTGLRRGDAVRLGRQHVRDGVATIKTEKTGTEVTLPILPILARTLEAGPCGDLTFIAGENGRPLTKESFGNLFRKACRDAGLHNRSAHGLRKAAATRAANAGATVAELEAIFGWQGGTMAALYTRAADRRRLAQRAMHKLARTTDEQTLPAPSGLTTRA